MTIKGTLIPIGGNENRGEGKIDEHDFIEEGILSKIVKESGGIQANIVIIPTASSIPEVVGKSYLNAFEKLGCSNVRVLNIQNRIKAEDARSLQLISEADCVLFTGGDQVKITSFIEGTLLHELLHKRYREDNFVIAGTSAGAMAMSKEMIARGSSKISLLKGAVKMKKGLNLIPELIIDTHFITRGRFGRLAEAVAIHSDLLGVGLAEDTGLIIKHGKEFTVIGSGMVILFDPSHLTHNSHSIMKKGVPISMSNLVTHILAKGDYFLMEDRTLRIKPLAEANYLDKVF
jgi:cyanophycinase